MDSDSAQIESNGYFENFAMSAPPENELEHRLLREVAWLKKKTIFVLGFESLGLFGDASRIEGDIEFQFRNATTSCSLDSAGRRDRSPRSIRSFQKGRSYMGDFVNVLFDNNLILNLEKQIDNSLSRGAWICFVVDEILDNNCLGFPNKGRFRYRSN